MFEQIDPTLREKITENLISSNAIQELLDKYDLNEEIVQYVPMCFADDLDVSARTMHGIIYFNSRLKDSDNIFHYAAHEITHTIEQCFGDGPTEGSTDDEDYLSNIHEQHGFQTQTKFISETEGPEKANEYIEKVLDHHKVPENEKEDKKEDLLRTAGLFDIIYTSFNDAVNGIKSLKKIPRMGSCQNCNRYFKDDYELFYMNNDLPLKDLDEDLSDPRICCNRAHKKIRGKDICVDCYKKMIQYQQTIPCKCGHSKSDHLPEENKVHNNDLKCNAVVEGGDYRNTKKCNCQNYSPIYDDYSDVRDSKQLFLDFEKENKKSKERKLDIVKIREQIQEAIDEGERKGKEDEFFPRKSQKLLRKEHPYRSKNIADLAKKITENIDKNASFDLGFNIFDQKKCANCGHIEGLHLGVPGIEEWCVSCNCIEYKKPVVIDDIKD